MKVTRINTPNKEADEQNGGKKRKNTYLRDIASEWSSHDHDRIC